MLTEVMLEINYYLIFTALPLAPTDAILSSGVAALTDILLEQRGWSCRAAAYAFSFFKRGTSPELLHLIVVASAAKSLIPLALFEAFLPARFANHICHS